MSRPRIVERILDYVRIDTQSDENSDTCPSIERQFELGRLLVEELKGLELKGVGEPEGTMDENGYVLAALPGTALGTVGVCAHMDTAPAFNGMGVNPQMVEGWSIGDTSAIFSIPWDSATHSHSFLFLIKPNMSTSLDFQMRFYYSIESK